MLAVIPTPADYDTRLRVSSAVFTALPMAEACQLLNAWSRETTPGWYATKHKHRLSQITMGTLVHLAIKHGWKGSDEKRWKGKVRVSSAGQPSGRPSRIKLLGLDYFRP